ncbi:MAG: MerR family transcriptional regulator [Tetrasphaera sp.]
MLTIGDFARWGQVSVRMLRHYDALGLLVPARVDQWTGYRLYDAEQLSRLNRLVALKDLGFSLAEIGPILDASISAEELRGMLLLRRTQVEEAIEADRARLRAIERRLRTIAKEDTMSDLQFTEKPLPSIRIHQRTATVAGQAEIAATIGPIFEELMTAGATLGYPDHGQVAWYGDGGEPMEIGAGVPAIDGLPPIPGTEPAELEAADRAVVTVHHGDMETIADTWQALHRYLGAQGLSPAGRCREVYHQTPLDRPDDWVTELQQPVA